VDCGIPVSFEEDRRFIAIGCGRGTFVWDTVKDLLLAELPPVTAPADKEHFSGAVAPVTSAAGDLAAIAHGSAVDVYRLPAERNSRPFLTIRHPSDVSSIAFATSGHDLVSSSVDGTLLVTRDDQTPVKLPGGNIGANVVGFVPDGRVVSVDPSGLLRVIDPMSATEIARVDLQVRALSIRPAAGGHRLLVIPLPGKQIPALLMDLDTNRLVPLDTHKGRVASARFVRDDKEVLTTGGDGVIRRWDAESGRLLQRYTEAAVIELDAVIDPGGTRLVTAGYDGFLRFWDLQTGAILWTLQAHRAINGLHFDGDQLVTRGYSGDLARWELPKRGAHARSVCLPTVFDEASNGLTEQTCEVSRPAPP
jgi:WD40 repeat protein